MQPIMPIYVILFLIDQEKHESILTVENRKDGRKEGRKEGKKEKEKLNYSHVN